MVRRCAQGQASGGSSTAGTPEAQTQTSAQEQLLFNSTPALLTKENVAAILLELPLTPSLKKRGDFLLSRDRHDFLTIIRDAINGVSTKI